MSTTEIWADKEITDYSNDKFKDRLKIALAVLFGGETISNAPQLVFKSNGRIIDLNFKLSSQSTEDKNQWIKNS